MDQCITLPSARRALLSTVATDTGRAAMVGTKAIAVANANPRSTILRRILRPFSLCVVGYGLRAEHGSL